MKFCAEIYVQIDFYENDIFTIEMEMDSYVLPEARSVCGSRLGPLKLVWPFRARAFLVPPLGF